MLDKNFTYLIQNDSTYISFKLDSGIYDTTRLIQHLNYNILYDSENNCYKNYYHKSKYKISHEQQLLQFLFPNKKQFQPTFNQNVTEQILKQFSK